VTGAAGVDGRWTAGRLSKLRRRPQQLLCTFGPCLSQASTTAPSPAPPMYCLRVWPRFGLAKNFEGRLRWHRFCIWRPGFSAIMKDGRQSLAETTSLVDRPNVPYQDIPSLQLRGRHGCLRALRRYRGSELYANTIQKGRCFLVFQALGSRYIFPKGAKSPITQKWPSLV
jgi:hypothetical protein